MAHEEDEFYGAIHLGGFHSSLDAYLQDRADQGTGMSVRQLTDKARAAAALETSAPAGLRVAFVTNLGSVLAYPDPPAADSQGTVVMVRTAEGDQTSLNGMVFVKFDDGRFMAVNPEHLRRAPANVKMASGFSRRVGSLGDLTGFLRWGQDGDNELVHRATKDLWSFEETEQGDYVISRLFDDTGSPVRV